MDVKPPVHVPEGDSRFADPTRGQNPAFFAVRQGYLAASQLVSDLVAAGAAAGLATPGPGSPPVSCWTRSRRHRRPARPEGLE